MSHFSYQKALSTISNSILVRLVARLIVFPCNWEVMDCLSHTFDAGSYLPGIQESWTRRQFRWAYRYTAMITENNVTAGVDEWSITPDGCTLIPAWGFQCLDSTSSFIVLRDLPSTISARCKGTSHAILLIAQWWALEGINEPEAATNVSFVFLKSTTLVGLSERIRTVKCVPACDQSIPDVANLKHWSFPHICINVLQDIMTGLRLM